MQSQLKVLVIGSGGREHALIKSFKKSSLLEKIWVLPGNDGMAADAIVVGGSVNDHQKILDLCLTEKIDLVFIGPEDPLVGGLSDLLRAGGILCVGPSQQAAQLEGSKIFAKEFMLRARIPTARSFVVDSVASALSAAENFSAPYILKADGLAAGKGVFICKTIDELRTASEDIFEKNKLGPAGYKALIEENLPGWELSYLILTNGENFECLPLAQDHKRLADHNKGPNTGGMGTVAPLKIDTILEQRILKQIIEPSVQQLKNENMIFRGILFIGVMVVHDQPYVLEYNTRFGDPETQVILPLIENDTVEIFQSLAKGELLPLKIKNHYSVCLVNAAEGYPDNVVKGTPIQYSESDADYLLFAGVKQDQNQLVTAGGRVLNIVATADTVDAALKKAYLVNERVQFKNRQFRSDIGQYLPRPTET